MIEFMSSWVKGLGLAIVIVSILEMLLPNNKTKKYVKMIMGLYVLFTMISPFVSNAKSFNIEEFDLEAYETKATSSSVSVNQSSMDERIEDLYQQELQKDMTKKLKEKGYLVTNCKVKAQISEKEEETKITKIKLKVQKIEEPEEKEEKLENQMVTQIQKIKPIESSIKKEEKTKQENTKINKTDIQNIKKFLIEEYGVSEKCLEIN